MAATNQPTTADLSAWTGTWRLDVAATTVEFRTKAMFGVLKVKGTLAAIEGGGTLGEDGTVTGSLVLDPASVSTKIKKRDEHLKSADFLDVATFPTMTYTVTGAAPAADGRVAVEGTLEVHGQTAPLPLLATATPSGPDAVVLSAEADVDRRQFGVSLAPMGARVDNHVVVSARFVRA